MPTWVSPAGQPMLELWVEDPLEAVAPPVAEEPPEAEDGVVCDELAVDPALPVEVIWWIVTGCSALVCVGAAAVEVAAGAVWVGAAELAVVVGVASVAVGVALVAGDVVAVAVAVRVLVSALALGALAAGVTFFGALAGLCTGLELEFEPHPPSTTVSAQTLRMPLYFRIEVIGLTP